ncbi:hypothetical protein Acr_17g0011970 [Actinidia rufa]|uniref:Sulfate transmembrane transporter n=1 Tax=Actinidia rufa TaxID=165716 RepID=A0A7J0G4A6_9ERIC|nr:hypothetical protein Acr_17g0011970 [Actinidia rufa]
MEEDHPPPPPPTQGQRRRHPLATNLRLKTTIWSKLGGAVGDLGTYIPIVLSLTLVSYLDLSTTPSPPPSPKNPTSPPPKSQLPPSPKTPTSPPSKSRPQECPPPPPSSSAPPLTLEESRRTSEPNRTAREARTATRMPRNLWQKSIQILLQVWGVVDIVQEGEDLDDPLGGLEVFEVCDEVREGLDPFWWWWEGMGEYPPRVWAEMRIWVWFWRWVKRREGASIDVRTARSRD